MSLEIGTLNTEDQPLQKPASFLLIQHIFIYEFFIQSFTIIYNVKIELSFKWEKLGQ